MRRLFSSISLVSLLSALLPACTQSNTDHCGNREGNATCSQQSVATPYCSICVADNNGCVADRPDDTCLATTAPATSTSTPSTSSTADPTTSTTGQTDTSGTTSTPTTDPTTSTTGQTDTSSGTTPATTTTSDTSTTSTDTSTSTDTTDTLDTLGTSTGSDTTTDTTTGSTTMEGPMCGDNKVEGDEVCDGANNNMETCKLLLPNKWGGGKLSCNDNCQSFNDTQCCIGVGQPCNYLTKPEEECCAPLKCDLGGTCKN